MEIETTSELVSKVYQKTKKNLSNFRKIVGRPLTLTEKILAGHLVEIEEKNLDEGSNYVYLNPDRVALQDVTGQMVLLQFMQADLKILAGHLVEIEEKNLDEGSNYVYLNPDRVALQDVTGQMVLLQFMQADLKQTVIPTTVHCDHLIRAKVGGEADTKIALDENSEIYKFLESASRKYGIGFWKPGAGIIHQVVLENYAFPGGLMIGTDSHTPNAGGLGMIAVGVGGVDAAETMAGLPWEILYPKRIGVYLTGEING